MKQDNKRLVTVALRLFPPKRLSGELKHIQMSVFNHSHVSISSPSGSHNTQSVTLTKDVNNCLVLLHTYSNEKLFIHALAYIEDPNPGNEDFLSQACRYVGYQITEIKAGKKDVHIDMTIPYFEPYEIHEPAKIA